MSCRRRLTSTCPGHRTDVRRWPLARVRVAHAQKVANVTAAAGQSGSPTRWPSGIPLIRSLTDPSEAPLRGPFDRHRPRRDRLMSLGPHRDPAHRARATPKPLPPAQHHHPADRQVRTHVGQRSFARTTAPHQGQATRWAVVFTSNSNSPPTSPAPSMTSTPVVRAASSYAVAPPITCRFLTLVISWS